MSTLTITHTHEAGTMIEGTARGDGTAAILKASGWRWGRSIGAWYVPNSRDRRPQEGKIARTAEALRGAGFAVELEVSHEVRTTAEIEAGKIARQADRVTALEAKADRKAAAAGAAWDRERAAVDRLPDNGQPILVGHYSERTHRNAIDRAHAAAGRAVAATRDAEEAERRAESAARTTGARYNAVTVGNRIAKLAAELRSIDRKPEKRRWYPATDTEPDTYRAPHPEEAERIRRAYAARRAEVVDQLAYWQQVRADQIEAGSVVDYGPENVQAGDLVLTESGGWRRVVRASAKSVTVETDYSWTDRVPWHKVRGHSAADHLRTGEPRR